MWPMYFQRPLLAQQTLDEERPVCYHVAVTVRVVVKCVVVVHDVAMRVVTLCIVSVRIVKGRQ